MMNRGRCAQQVEETGQDCGKDTPLITAIIPESQRDPLPSTALACLATTRPKGEQQVSAVWFPWDETYRLFAVNKKRQKNRIVLRASYVAIAVSDPAHPNRTHEVRAVVARSDDDRDFRFITAMSQKYPVMLRSRMRPDG